VIKTLTVIFAVAAILSITTISTSFAQIVYGDPTRADASIIYQSWKLTYEEIPEQPESSLTQSAFPVYVFLPVAEDWEVHINAAISNSHLDGGDEGNSVASLSTPLVRVYRSFADDQVFLCAGFDLPGGKTKLDSTELPISELIAGDYLTLPIKQLGRGFGLLLQAGGAQQYEQILYGGSISYFMRGSYTYAEGGSDYNPGDEFTVQGSATLPLDEARIDLDIGYKYFVADQLGSQDIFKNGDQFSLALSGAYDFGRTLGRLSLLQLVRAKDSRRSGTVFTYEESNSNGNKTMIAGSVRHRITPQVSGTFLVNYRMLSANDWSQDNPAYFGSSNLFSIGAELGYSSEDDRYSVFGRFLLHDGSANDDRIGISGTEITIGGRARL
jgi:hypothetical protein